MGGIGRAPGFVEAPEVHHAFLSGCAGVFCDGANLHFSMYQEQIGADGTRECVIVSRAVMPSSAWFALRDMAEFEILSQGLTVPPHIRIARAMSS